VGSWYYAIDGGRTIAWCSRTVCARPTFFRTPPFTKTWSTPKAIAERILGSPMKSGSEPIAREISAARDDKNQFAEFNQITPAAGRALP